MVVSPEKNEVRKLPEIKDRAELRAHYETLYGKPVADALDTSVQDRKATLEQLKASGMNGKAEEVMREYGTYRQEFDRKAKLDETWAQKGWRWTKEGVKGAVSVATAPFRFAWKSFKKHPILTTLAIAALAAGGTALTFYLAGEWELFMTATGLSKITGGIGAAGELIPPTLPTTPLPGGGLMDIPSATLPDIVV